MHLSPFTPIRSLSLGGVLAMLSLVPAQAAITLTVDALAQTVTWSGSATSDSFAVRETGYFGLRLGIGNWSGGTIVGSSGSIDSNLNPGSRPGVSFDDNSDQGRLVIANVRNSFYTDLGVMDATPGDPASASVTITGDGQAYSYAGLSDLLMDYLESLDGTQLYFQDDGGGAGIFNIGGPAGQIVVVPEPSSALLLLAAPFLALRRRRGGVRGAF